MDISLADERAFQITPQVALEAARVRVDDKRTSLVAGTVGALFSRPKPEEIRLVGGREPSGAVLGGDDLAPIPCIDRNRTFTLTMAGPEVNR